VILTASRTDPLSGPRYWRVVRCVELNIERAKPIGRSFGQLNATLEKAASFTPSNWSSLQNGDIGPPRWWNIGLKDRFDVRRRLINGLGRSRKVRQRRSFDHAVNFAQQLCRRRTVDLKSTVASANPAGLADSLPRLPLSGCGDRRRSAEHQAVQVSDVPHGVYDCTVCRLARGLVSARERRRQLRE
jgi:hypothetical protein